MIACKTILCVYMKYDRMYDATMYATMLDCVHGGMYDDVIG